ncbi:MAG: response regulator [Oscillospiraceae bacterium]|nr:response regulator [Oscillospiraceae bacterium]
MFLAPDLFMLNIDQLIKISGLNSAKIETMDDGSLGEFTAAAKSFIDRLPKYEENIKNTLKNKDYGELTKSLAAVCETLNALYAEKLVESCSNYLSIIADIEYEKLQAFIIDFIKTISALSIDLQMVEYKAAPEATAEAPPETAGTNTILAVDDVNFFLNNIKTMLDGSGYKVTCISSGISALNYLKKNRPGLFILDIEMPEMNGYELAQKIRASGQSAPIIFLTGNAKKEYVIKAMQAGAADFIIKPVSKDQLLERIGKYIKPGSTEE